MKAVNQSVGRAIRHKGDYAAILFLDHRCVLVIHSQYSTSCFLLGILAQTLLVSYLVGSANT